MYAGLRNPQTHYEISHGTHKHILEQCTEEKDLGVVFDPELKFDSHITAAIGKANRMLGIIRRTFSGIKNKIFIKLYKSLVRPHLEYGNQIWHPYLKRQSESLERVQRRATKLVKSLQNHEYNERLRWTCRH